MIANGIASVLRSLVGDYVEGINGEHFKVGKMLRKGEVVLKNLRVKPTALEALQLPVRVRSGVVRELRAKVPWAHLSSRPVVLSVEGVTLVIEPESHDKAAIARLNAARHRSIRVLDNFNREQEEGLSDDSEDVANDNDFEERSDDGGDQSDEDGSDIDREGGEGGDGGGGEAWLFGSNPL